MYCGVSPIHSVNVSSRRRTGMMRSLGYLASISTFVSLFLSSSVTGHHLSGDNQGGNSLKFSFGHGTDNLWKILTPTDDQLFTDSNFVITWDDADSHETALQISLRKTGIIKNNHDTGIVLFKEVSSKESPLECYMPADLEEGDYQVIITHPHELKPDFPHGWGIASSVFAVHHHYSEHPDSDALEPSEASPSPAPGRVTAHIPFYKTVTPNINPTVEPTIKQKADCPPDRTCKIKPTTGVLGAMVGASVGGILLMLIFIYVYLRFTRGPNRRKSDCAELCSEIGVKPPQAQENEGERAGEATEGTFLCDEDEEGPPGRLSLARSPSKS
ncbi:hypothetical protein BJ508DRAFT_152987 [Ascobolus immersus RN42]|uniref:Uncharacterized protein n=1 Tax=Ascobolus immersus RN42 TaxID=1160509 RepID=A0A3N4HXS0_ASCIM|nr:hypothetical protein BJ508DRAFT_152987 [Ascobolus immersus RN42]